MLDALQYLHWRNYCHLDLQPDNIVMASVRSVEVKLVDFGSAQKVSKLGTNVSISGWLDFMCKFDLLLLSFFLYFKSKFLFIYLAPEVLNEEPAYPQSDIWSVGVLTYVLLSGISPFRGADDEETKANITFERYRFEHLYKGVSPELTRFLLFVFKRTPNKRPTVEECYEHRWLQATDFMIKKREHVRFNTQKIKVIFFLYIYIIYDQVYLLNLFIFQGIF